MITNTCLIAGSFAAGAPEAGAGPPAPPLARLPLELDGGEAGAPAGAGALAGSGAWTAASGVACADAAGGSTGDDPGSACTAPALGAGSSSLMRGRADAASV